MVDRRRQLTGFAVLALVLLRLAIGWHFFTAGTEKVAFDRTTGGYRVAFSAEGFLNQAKGPFAERFQAFVPDVHHWRQLLAVPKQNKPESVDEVAKAAQWADDYKRQRETAAKEKQPIPIEFPPSASYTPWAKQIVEDWNAVLTKVTAIDDLSQEQKQQAIETFQNRKQQLADFLADEEDAIAEYQHQLWRLGEWKATREAKDLPFQEQRIATKGSQTAVQPNAWVSEVREIEQSYLADLKSVLSTKQLADSATTNDLNRAITDESQVRLARVNTAVTILTLGVGICLLLGFFTRIASLAGALFVAAVIATQPPWVPGAESTVNQMVELAGLLVLAGTGAGRWFGLDYLTYALFARHEKPTQ
jgi:uncharacterized membrane protein YphA (DoxX/SURF4 family)